MKGKLFKKALTGYLLLVILIAPANAQSSIFEGASSRGIFGGVSERARSIFEGVQEGLRGIFEGRDGKEGNCSYIS